MGKALFVFLAMSLAASASWAVPQKIQCNLTSMKKIDVFLDQELNLAKKPVLKFVDDSSHWALQIGALRWDTRNPEGKDFRKRSRKLSGQVREYSFWVNSLLQYQFEVDMTRQALTLYWWGTGRRALLAEFNCAITE